MSLESLILMNYISFVGTIVCNVTQLIPLWDPIPGSSHILMPSDLSQSHTWHMQWSTFKETDHN